MPNQLSFIGGFSDSNYYSVASALGINDIAYTIGAVVAVGEADFEQAIFSSLDATNNTGYEIRTGGGYWQAGHSSLDHIQSFSGQAGTGTVTQPRGSRDPISGMSRALFVALVATQASQILYINGQYVAAGGAAGHAAATGAVYIGRAARAGAPCTDVLINSVFYAASALTGAQLQTIYRWYQAYGFLPDDGTGGGVLATIAHHWSLFDNKDGNQASWISRGATGGITMTRTGTLSIASSGHAIWGW